MQLSFGSLASGLGWYQFDGDVALLSLLTLWGNLMQGLSFLFLMEKNKSTTTEPFDTSWS